MKKLSVFALLLLAGCGAAAEPLYLPDGSAGYRVTCGGYFSKMSDCIAEAGNVCGPNGYQMYDALGKPLTVEAQNQSVIAALNNMTPKGNTRSSDPQQAMFVKCRNAPADPIAIHSPLPVDSQPIPMNGH